MCAIRLALVNTRVGLLPFKDIAEGMGSVYFVAEAWRYNGMNNSFAEVVEEVKNLSTEEKRELQILIEKYLVEEKREEIYENYQAGLNELKEGELAFSSDVNALKGMLND
ncbi:MAG: hypothetical protein ABR577_14460 [Pyrinomonadaceae bacterium]